MRWRDLQALAACARLGWDEARAQRLSLLGQSALYVMVLAIFWALWGATPLHERPGAPARETLLWYLAITEWIVFIAGARYREVEREIASGAIESALLRPVPHGLATLARWAGLCTWQAGVLAVVACVATVALTGSGPPRLVLAPLIVLSSALSLALVLLCHLQLGYAAVWLGAAGPLFWIWQKFLFVLGGLLMPLFLYPAPLRWPAEHSPFAAMLAAPASLVFDGGSHAPAVLANQLVWLAILAALALVVSRAATARLVRAGGAGP